MASVEGTDDGETVTGVTIIVSGGFEDVFPEGGSGIEESMPSAATDPTKNIVGRRPMIREKIFRIWKRQKISATI